MSKDWIDDCMHFWGKVLDGKYAHWCPEWDELPIDETCKEFENCICFHTVIKERKRQAKMRTYLRISGLVFAAETIVLLTITLALILTGNGELRAPQWILYVVIATAVNLIVALVINNKNISRIDN